MGQMGEERWEAASQEAGKRGTGAVGHDLTSQANFFFFFFFKENFLCQQRPQQHPNYKSG